ncbi:protein-disulfide reductase DsbD domain-containing protein, partial [Pseudomonas sp.]|uniref:protein-disulfide reductase DsbD domain-containing protein n=1 Tax=Pseudomonas sp. TaxID=306 RepID=UPI0028AFFE67
MRVFLLLASLLLSTALSANPFASKPDFLPVEQAFRVSHERLSDGQLRVDIQIQPGYYLYQKRLKFDGLPADQHPALPPALNHHDEFFGDSAIYREQLELRLPANARGTLRLGWQGCADAGLCYPPQTTVIELGEAIASAPLGAAPAAPAAQAADQALATGLLDGSLAWSLLAFFGLGLLLAFTP